MVASPPKNQTKPLNIHIKWEKLPDDYILPDDPVDNKTQPALAAALIDSLATADRLTPTTATTTNYGICATVDDRIVVKAPDWCFIPEITAPLSEVERSYTPELQGEFPLIVMEFLSETEGSEFSMRRTPPVGKMFFYERILKVPNYVIFEPDSGSMEVYRLDQNGSYQPQGIAETGRYWIPELGLFLGTWQGEREQRSGYWLRWWDESDQLLLWSLEKMLQEKQRADEAEQRAQQLEERLRSLGIDPNQP
jgi:Uma2 family endonuclease